MNTSPRVRFGRATVLPDSAFRGFRYPSAIIIVAVRWYLRYKLTYRDVAELLAERGIELDHVTIWRWVQRFTPLLISAARPCRHAVGTIWCVDETYKKVAGKQRYVYRAVDEFGQVVDVYVSTRRNKEAARRFFHRALDSSQVDPEEVVTDRAPSYVGVIEDDAPQAYHNTDQYANNRIEWDHGHLKAWLRPMRGLKSDSCARVLITGHALVQNLRRGHSALTDDAPEMLRVKSAFDELIEMM